VSLQARAVFALLLATLAAFSSAWAPSRPLAARRADPRPSPPAAEPDVEADGAAGRAPSACTPLATPRGHWGRVFIDSAAPIHATSRNGLWRADPVLSWVRAPPCAWSVPDADALFSQLDGRVLVVMGDSTARNFVFNLVSAVSNCCVWQLSTGAAACDAAAVADAASCDVLATALAHAWRRDRRLHDTDPEWTLRRGARTVVLRFFWVTYPRGLRLGWQGPWLENFLGGRERADAVLLATGYWPVGLDGETPRSGMEMSLEEWDAVLSYVADGAARLPALARAVVVRGLYTDEVDSAAWPVALRNTSKPGHRDVTPDVFAEFNARLGAAVRASGFRFWDVAGYTDVRAGGVDRAWNTPYLTYDGLHLQTQAEIVMAWDWLSHVAGTLSPAGPPPIL
jgi:hypothetical protein